MAKTSKTPKNSVSKKRSSQKSEPKQYLPGISKRWTYGVLALLSIVVLWFFLFVPHYKPVQLASSAQIQEAHREIINEFFIQSTTCTNDNVDKTTRVKTFNKYFKVNKYANRAVIRGCNDSDSLLALADGSDHKWPKGVWYKTDVNIVLSSRQNPTWQKMCLIDDIATADDKVRPENVSIDAANYLVCRGLTKQSYIEVHFHF